MTNKEAIEFIDDRMCWGRGKWSEHHMPEIDEYWQAGLMAIEALKAQDAKDAKSMPSQFPSGDIVYRQDAMDAIFSEPLYESGMKKRDADAVVPAIYEKIKSLQSAQPEKRTEERTEMHSCDLISRQAAIDILDAYQVMIENGEENPYAWARLRMSELPSAQPKMVCVANVTLTEEQVQEVFEKAKRSVLSVIEPSAQPRYTEIAPEKAATEISCGSLAPAAYWLDVMIQLEQMGYVICRREKGE